MAIERRKQALGEMAERSVPDSLDLWPSIRSRAVISAKVSRAHVVGRGSRLTIGFAAAMALALFAAGVLLWDRPEPVSAEAILERAQAAELASSDTQTHHLVSVYRSGLGDDQSAITEEWVSGDRMRHRLQFVDAQGGVIRTLEDVDDGSQQWSMMETGGQIQVYHTNGPTKKNLGGTSGLSSLADLLALWNNDKSCMSARLEGEQTLVGRPTYVIVVEPRPDACPLFPANEGGTSAPPTEEQKKLIEEKSRYLLGEMRLWIDKESYLSLKTVSVTQQGLVLDDFEVTSIEYGIDIPDSMFTFVPPAGATVVESGKSGVGK